MKVKSINTIPIKLTLSIGHDFICCREIKMETCTISTKFVFPLQSVSVQLQTIFEKKKIEKVENMLNILKVILQFIARHF